MLATNNIAGRSGDIKRKGRFLEDQVNVLQVCEVEGRVYRNMTG